jgi:hypothetical protein
VPAAAVIPAPIAYTKVVAVKKLVVEFLSKAVGPLLTGCVHVLACSSSGRAYLVFIYRVWDPRLLL